MFRPVFDGRSWAVSRTRIIDEQTILDLLGLLEYDAERDVRLEESGADRVGDTPSDDPIECIYYYILDALGVPPEGTPKAAVGEHPRFSRMLRFSREWFCELFYSDYLLEKQERGLTLPLILEKIKAEIASNLDGHYV